MLRDFSYDDLQSTTVLYMCQYTMLCTDRCTYPCFVLAWRMTVVDYARLGGGGRGGIIIIIFTMLTDGDL